MNSTDEMLVRIGRLRGGEHQLYKPVVVLEFYEHDDEATVRIGRCKGMEEIVLTVSAMGGSDAIGRALSKALAELLGSGAS